MAGSVPLSRRRSLSKELRVVDVLTELTVATHTIYDRADGPNISGWPVYILILRREDTEIRGFKNHIVAAEEYANLERHYLGDGATQLVLVSGESITNLRKAYRNYFNDSAAFIATVRDLKKVSLQEFFERREEIIKEQ
jgi:hypothetical protein